MAKFEYESSVIDQIVIKFALETGELKGMIDTLSEDIKTGNDYSIYD